MKKSVISLVAILLIVTAIITGYATTHETIPAGCVGYIYDRTAGPEDDVLPGTSVLSKQLTGRVKINPITQSILVYPTTIQSRNWTRLEEGDNDIDMSMSVSTKEGTNVDADVYISIRPKDIGKLVVAFGSNDFSIIIDNDLYGLVKGKINNFSQSVSIYDIQTSRLDIQTQAFDVLYEEFERIYGIELVRLELGSLIPPKDIQEKIDAKTNALNDVELAKLKKEEQEQINQKDIAQQKAESEKELVRRQTEADAAAYEITKQAEAKKTAQETEAATKIAAAKAEAEVASIGVEKAKMEKEAELEKQKIYTDEYFENKRLDIQKEAMNHINSSVQTIITSGEGEGYSALLGLKEVLERLEDGDK